MAKNKNKTLKDEELQYVPIIKDAQYEALRAIHAQMRCSIDQLDRVIHKYFEDDIDDF